MKKNAIALAVGALCLAPAAQAQIVFGNDQIGTVQIYGRLYPQVASFKSTGATQAGEGVSTLVATSGVLGTSGANHGQRWSVDSLNSRLGFRGERKLGNTGLKGIWQIEQALGFDDPDAEEEPWANRDSFAGLSSATLGTVRLGNLRTVYRTYTGGINMFGISGGNFTSSSNVISHIGVGNNRAARFHERRKNSIHYETSQFAGFQAAIQYSPDEQKGDPGRLLNANLWSYGVKYEAGPLEAAVAQEIHNDFFGGSNNVATSIQNGTTVGGVFTPSAGARSRDMATRLMVTYSVTRQHRITANFARLQYKERGQTLAAPRFEGYEHNTWEIGWEARWGGPWRTAFEYAVGEEGKCTLTGGVACSTRGLKGTLLTGGVSYAFDRQTSVHFIAARLNNGPSARYDNWPSGSPARGADTTQLALGVKYDF